MADIIQKEYIMQKDSNLIEMNIADTVMERPYGFQIGKQQFYLYPVSLGKTYLISRLLDSLEMNTNIIKQNPYMEALRLCQGKRETVCRLLSYHTINKKEELFDNSIINKRCTFFEKNLSNEEMAQLLVMVLTDDNIGTFIKHLGIDRERKELARISKIKEKKGNSITFGGKSVFGSLILPACEKLNMTPQQIVWDISYSFLQMLMADAITSVYLTDEEKKEARIHNNQTFINADDPENIAKISAMRWD
jgi:hypothetical protein